jgi:hypothetical protein
MTVEKFLPPFIAFIHNHFDASNHQFIFISKKTDKYGLSDKYLVTWIDKKSKLLKLLISMQKSDKIIIHGLWHEIFIKLLFFQPWLLKKCYHVLWGGDFYFPKKHSWFKKQIIKKMGHFITYIKGDYELVKEWYKANGEYHESFMYPSNLYKELNINSHKEGTINIQIGNSADPTNNHMEIFGKLSKYANEDITIYVPLSYGDSKYAQEVIKKGYEVFGDKFKPMLDFMPYEEYLQFLGKIDIAIFAHRRQQAMGNTITLLGLGKKVYMRSDVVQWKLFDELNVKVYEIDKFSLELMDKNLSEKNSQNIREYFSQNRLIEQLKIIFNDKS